MEAEEGGKEEEAEELELKKMRIDKSLVKEVRERALDLLAGGKCQVNERITVRVKPQGRSTCPYPWKAVYRSHTQFGGNGPVFWLCEEQTQPDWVDKQALKTDMVDSIIHEYGHVIEEWGRYRNPEIKRLIEEGFSGNEDFAEGFIDFVLDECQGDYRYEEILKLYKKDVFNEQP